MAMYFYGIPDNELPADAEYYFNVFVITVAVSPELADEVFPEDVIDLWYLDHITDSQPYAVHFFVDDEEPEIVFTAEDGQMWDIVLMDQEEEEEEDNSDTEFEMEFFPHSVLEIHPTLGISFYDMLDFYTKDPFRID